MLLYISIINIIMAFWIYDWQTIWRIKRTDELKAKIETIRELVVNTTSGKWVYAEYKNCNTIENVNGDCIAKQVYSEDGKYIAATNPQVIREMLEYINQLEKQIDWFAENIMNFMYTLCPPNRKFDAMYCKNKKCTECWKETAQSAADESVKVARLEKEANWLACKLETKEHACEFCSNTDCGGIYGFEKCGYQGPDNWRKAAKKAIEKEEDAKEAESDAYWR